MFQLTLPRAVKAERLQSQVYALRCVLYGRGDVYSAGPLKCLKWTPARPAADRLTWKETLLPTTAAMAPNRTRS